MVAKIASYLLDGNKNSTLCLHKDNLQHNAVLLIFLKFCQNLTHTQLNLTYLGWVWHKNALPPNLTTNSMSTLSQLLLTLFSPNLNAKTKTILNDKIETNLVKFWNWYIHWILLLIFLKTCNYPHPCLQKHPLSHLDFVSCNFNNPRTPLILSPTGLPAPGGQ